MEILKNVKKYFAVAQILFKTQSVYRFDVIMTAIGTVGRIVFAWILWGAVFAGRTAGETIGGFTFGGMLSYYVASSFFSSINTGGVSGEVSARIRGGTFSKYMVLPVNPQLHFLAQSLGAALYYALFSIAAAVFSAALFRVNMVFFTNPAQALLALAALLLGLTFMMSYHFFIGILAFKFQDIGFFLHVQGNLIAFASGVYVPLSLLPPPVLRLFRFLPFPHVIYTPAMLITGQAGIAEGLFSLAVLSVWVLVMMSVSQLSYNTLRVRFDGVGI